LKSGTTNGILYILHINKIPKYVIKMDKPKLIAATEAFLLTYKDVNLCRAFVSLVVKYLNTSITMN
ncbi:hypothetical protein XO47_15270, partial [Listeria monocytogenes]|nr:hypothetical protein [Listeria monocytogenes]